MVQEATPATAEPVSAATRYYVLFILILVTTIGFMDRQIMGILVEPIRADLGLTDSELGALGLIFAVVYVAACFPVARLADRWSRVNVIAIGVTFWSLMTGACGFALNTAHMFLGRIGVALGEAGGAPPSHALVADLFPRERRATAMSLLMLCSPIGLAGGLFLGGWAAEAYGWRWAFFIAGGLGVLLGPLVYFTFPKVRQGAADGLKQKLKQPPFLQTMRQLLGIRSLLCMLIGAGLLTLLSMSVNYWAPAFLARSHGMSTGEIGAMLGSTLGVGSFTGHLLGGLLFDFAGRRDLRWHLWLAACIGLAAGGLVFYALTAADIQLAVYVLAVQAFVSGLFTGPMIAIIMNLAPVMARATASALLTLMVNVLGMGIGPQLVGWISDFLRPGFGEESLRYALLCSTAIVIPAACFFVLASLFYRKDLDAAEVRNTVDAAGSSA